MARLQSRGMRTVDLVTTPSVSWIGAQATRSNRGGPGWRATWPDSTSKTYTQRVHKSGTQRLRITHIPEIVGIILPVERVSKAIARVHNPTYTEKSFSV
jgi:hypothetical protein